MPPTAGRGGPTVATLPDIPVSLALEVGELRRSLVFATLTYRLALTNAGGKRLGPILLTGDLRGAHASMRLDDMARADGALPALHSLSSLGPGENATFEGELRLPLAEVPAVRQGDAALFVPLVRLRVADAAGGWTSTHLFVVGEPGQQRGALRPLRLDTMPGTIRGLLQREIALDLASAAG